MQWVNWPRRALSGLIRSGQATTIGSRVPPRWLAICLPHWNGVLHGMRPGRRAVRAPCAATQSVDAAVLLDQLELLVGVEHEAVEEGHLVERAGDRALHAGAVVAPDVEDQRVVEVAHLLDGVEQPADVPVGVLLEAGVDLHLPGVELLLCLVERVPGREDIGPFGQLGVLRDDAELLLALERRLAQLVPAVVELALVLVGPLLGDVVRRVRAAGRVVHHPRLLRRPARARRAATRRPCR